MMLLNKKGISIIELIISVALISVVMLFMYRLLADVTYAKDNDKIASLNQEQRVVMISHIEKQIRDDSRVDTISISGSSLLFKHGTTELYRLTSSTSNSTLTFTNTETGKKIDVWTIQGGKIAASPSCNVENSLSDIRLYMCTFKIYTESKINSVYDTVFTRDNGTQVTVTIDNNNTIDDINLSFMLYK